MHEHDDSPCWDAHCAPHLTHHDAGVRELIARAEARGAERVAQAVVPEGELRAIIRNAISLNDPAATAQWMRDHLHITRREEFLCGHESRVRGCGGCDPAAVEYAIEDGERLKCPNASKPGPFACPVRRCPCCTPPLRDEIAVLLHKLFCDGRHDNTDGPCWTAWRQEADLLMIPVEVALALAWERGHRGCSCGRPIRCHNPYSRGGTR